MCRLSLSGLDCCGFRASVAQGEEDEAPYHRMVDQYVRLFGLHKKRSTEKRLSLRIRSLSLVCMKKIDWKKAKLAQNILIFGLSRLKKD